MELCVTVELPKVVVPAKAGTQRRIRQIATQLRYQWIVDVREICFIHLAFVPDW
jgi:hypothetical protein